MKYQCPLLVVEDIERSRKFYCEMFGLRVVSDFGANISFTGGLSLQSRETFAQFIESDSIAYGANDAEIYFEEEDFDGFAARLADGRAELVHGVKEHPWGQRTVRLYDPDRHIIEVGEDMSAVCMRFLRAGLSVAQTAERMDVPEGYVRRMVRAAERKAGKA